MCISSLDRGGAQKNFSLLCRSLLQAGIVQGITVHAWWGGFYEERLREMGVSTFVVSPTGCGVLRTFSRLASLAGTLFRQKKTIETAHGFLPLGGFLAWIFSVLTGHPFIYTLRSSLKYFSLRRSVPRYILHKLCLWRAELITCNCAVLPEALPGKRIVYVPNAIEEPEGSLLLDESIKQRFFPDATRFYAVTVSTMRPPKDIPTLLRVAEALADVSFVLVGGGGSLPSFKQLCDRLGLKNVCFTGFQENVYPFLHYADACVLLTDHEGFPNSILEAMIARCPVIASNIREIASVLTDGTDSLLVKNRDVHAIGQAISKIRDDATLGVALADAGYTLVKKRFSVGEMLKRHQDVLMRAVSAGGGNSKKGL